MKKTTKNLIGNLIGLVITGVFYFLIVMPIIDENIRLPYNGKMFGALLVWVITIPLLSFLIPGIIALVAYTNKKTFWRYFYYTGWIIYILILIFYSYALGHHSM